MIFKARSIIVDGEDIDGKRSRVGPLKGNRWMVALDGGLNSAREISSRRADGRFVEVAPRGWKNSTQRRARVDTEDKVEEGQVGQEKASNELVHLEQKAQAFL